MPQPVAEAIGKLPLGTRERAIFELPRNPYRFAADERVIFKTASARAVMFTMRPGGSDLVYADFGGNFARLLSSAGEDAMAEFIGRQLSDHFAGGAPVDIGRIDVTRWSGEPFVLGGSSVAMPGAGGSRRVLTQPVAERLFFAGEAAHEDAVGHRRGRGTLGRARRRSGAAISSRI